MTPLAVDRVHYFVYDSPDADPAITEDGVAFPPQGTCELEINFTWPTLADSAGHGATVGIRARICLKQVNDVTPSEFELFAVRRWQISPSTEDDRDLGTHSQRINILRASFEIAGLRVECGPTYEDDQQLTGIEIPSGTAYAVLNAFAHGHRATIGIHMEGAAEPRRFEIKDGLRKPQRGLLRERLSLWRPARG